MRHITEVHQLQLENTAVALGKFDGFHLGHQLLLDQVRSWQEQDGLTGVIFTFAPAGQQIGSVKRIDSRQEKLVRAAGTGIQVLLEYPFSREFAAMQPERFVEDILVRKMGIRAAAVGEDFRFGRNRTGDAALLTELGVRYGFRVAVFEKRKERGREISSSVIREAVETGDMELAAACLGRGYTISGPVVHGKGLGHTIGIPTANQDVPEEKLVPPYGVYAVKIHWRNRSYDGIANLGCKPTVSRDPAVGLETYLFDVSQDFYGEWLEVELLHFLRPERRFESLDALTAQMQADIRRVRENNL